MIGSASKIGRAGTSAGPLKKSGDNWYFIMIRAQEGGLNSNSQTVFSKITFADPVIRVSANSEYWFKWYFNRRMRFNDELFSIEAQQAKNGEASTFLRTANNNGVDRCIDGSAAVILAGEAPIIHIPPSETDGRCRCNLFANYQIGSTRCYDTGENVYKILLNGTIENVDLENGFNSFNYKPYFVEIKKL